MRLTCATKSDSPNARNNMLDFAQAGKNCESEINTFENYKIKG